jgi:cell division protein FtsL
VPALLGLAIVIVGFATLMMRLEVTQEGYRLSVLKQQVHTLEDEDRRLGIETAELASHRRLRALAVKYGLQPPKPGQVVMLP